MFVGPVFTRELVTVPRRTRLYVSRATYVSALFVLMCTAWLILAGTQVIRSVGDLARFGATLFQILGPLQLALAILFSALLAASAVAQEKDRRTLVLLLLTNLSNSELVLGKLLAGMLNVLVLLAASLPVFMACALFGGVSFEQIARVRGHAGQRAGLRQPRFDRRPVAGKNLPDVGLDGAGTCFLAGRRRGAGAWPLWPGVEWHSGRRMGSRLESLASHCGGCPADDGSASGDSLCGHARQLVRFSSPWV